MAFNADTEDFDQAGILRGNTQSVISLQYDTQSQHVMTNAVDGQVMAWELSQFTRVDAAKVKDLEWHRKACLFSWDTMGIWQGEQEIVSASVSDDKQLLAVGDKLN